MRISIARTFWNRSAYIQHRERRRRVLLSLIMVPFGLVFAFLGYSMVPWVWREATGPLFDRSPKLTFTSDRLIIHESGYEIPWHEIASTSFHFSQMSQVGFAGAKQQVTLGETIRINLRSTERKRAICNACDIPSEFVNDECILVDVFQLDRSPAQIQQLISRISGASSY